MKKITVVGCGVMGSTLINALMNGGYEVSIVAPHIEKAQKLIERGAKYSATLNEAEENEIILLNLPHHGIVKDVLLSTDREKLAGKILIDSTTSMPDEVEELDEITKGIGMKYLDCKLLMYPGTVGPETGYAVYSGNKEAFSYVADDILLNFGKAVFLGEEVTAASVTDIAVLNVHFAAMAAMAESAAFCIKKGINVRSSMEQIEQILPIMLEGNFRAYATELEGYNREFRDAGECTLRIETKAMETIKQAINSTGVKTPCGDAVLDLFNAGILSGLGSKDACAIVNELI